MFGDVKILKNNLMKLPFPNISKQQDEIFIQLADDIISGHAEKIKTADKIIFDIFSINSDDQHYINKMN
ncbi:hypothetical protein SDC9_211990 [bioreactor metagenome]|uniref:Uncharacterized protein n=1 Tax=bioreactor metagenome TaxID=1076179 RepID=A0A645JN86_9ZZZZ